MNHDMLMQGPRGMRSSLDLYLKHGWFPKSMFLMRLFMINYHRLDGVCLDLLISP
jgi:hypothetical protein